MAKAEFNQAEVDKLAATMFEQIRQTENKRIGSLEVDRQGLVNQINDLEHLSQQMNDGRNVLADAESQQRAVSNMKNLCETGLGNVEAQLKSAHDSRDFADAQLDALKQKGVESEVVKTEEGREEKARLGNERGIEEETEKRKLTGEATERFGDIAKESLENASRNQDVSDNPAHSPGPNPAIPKPECDPIHPQGLPTQTMVVHGDGSSLTNPSSFHDAPDPSSALLFVAVAGVYGGQKLAEAGKEFVEASKNFGQEFKDKHLTAPEVKVELHDLPKEQAAAAALTKSDQFVAMSTGEKTAEMKSFFANQDTQYQDSYNKFRDEASAMLREVHGNVPSQQLLEQQKQLNSDIQAMHDAAKQQSGQFRGELVQNVLKEDVAKDVQQKNTEQIQKYDKRLEDLNKEAPKEVRENFIQDLNARGEQKVEERTAEIQKTQFPEYPPPPKQEMSGPGSGGPGSGGPGGGGPGGDGR